MGLKISNAAAEKPTVWLYGDIGAYFGGITADDFRKALETVPAKAEIELHINSDGGIFFDGVAMQSILRQRKAPVHVIVDGIAASAASIVAMGGTTISMATHSWLMIHEARSAGEGTADDFRAEAERLDALNSEIVRIYSGRWKGDAKALPKALKDETWYTSEQAIESGLADNVIDTMAVAAHIDTKKAKKFAYHNVPRPLIAPEPKVFQRLQEREAVLTELFPQQEQPCESTS